MKLENLTTGTVMRSGFVAPASLRAAGGVCLQPVRPRRADAAPFGFFDGAGHGTATTPGLPTSAPPIT